MEITLKEAQTERNIALAIFIWFVLGLLVGYCMGHIHGILFTVEQFAKIGGGLLGELAKAYSG